MLKKENRLQKERDFQKIFKSSRPVFSQNLLFRLTKTPGANKPARFGFVISNKIDKRATRRNALKRKLRAIAAEFLPQAAGFDIIVIVKQKFSYPFDFNQIKKQFVEGMTKAGVVK